jgi:hypothetical protein
MAPRAFVVLGLGVLNAVLAGCGRDGESDCVVHPCPLPLAIAISVTAATGGPVAGVSVEISGAATGSMQCNTSSTATACAFPGMPGTYNLKVSAPGFLTVTQVVTVQGSAPPCGCPTVFTQHLDLVLSAASSARAEGWAGTDDTLPVSTALSSHWRSGAPAGIAVTP